MGKEGWLKKLFLPPPPEAGQCGARLGGISTAKSCLAPPLAAAGPFRDGPQKCGELRRCGWFRALQALHPRAR
jgi:hypothetical protein